MIQISPAKIASIKCSKYSMPNLEHTSRANRLPPRGTPKNAERAPAIPIKVCFLTTFLELCLKTFLDKNPAVAAQIATSGASGPKLPPANIVNKLKDTKDDMCMRRIYYERQYPHQYFLYPRSTHLEATMGRI